MRVPSLLVSRRFGPLFVAQLLGAFNDNLVKNALVIGVTFHGLGLAGLSGPTLVAIASALFIAPFFALSARAGGWADAHVKSTLVGQVKAIELAVVLVAGLGFVLESAPLLLAALTGLGVVATAFGPVKYAILPELLDEAELVSGNALVEAGTFLAILAGTIAGGLLATNGLALLGLGGVAGLAAWGAARRVPPTPPPAASGANEGPAGRGRFAEMFAAAREAPAVFNSIMGLSWFWFVGAALLAVLPGFTRDALGAGEGVVTLFLATFCVGLGVGALLASAASRGRVELGLVPLGALGLSGFLVDLFFAGGAGAAHAGAAGGALADVSSFLARPGAARVLGDLAGLAIASGLFTVPLYALVQERARPAVRSRVIAANNVLNAAFMVAASAMLVGLDARGVPAAWTFVVLAVMNVVVAIYMYQVIPEFVLRFVVFALASVGYRLRVEGEAHVPREGAAVLVANHVTFVDWLFIAAIVRRPPRFVMYHAYFKLPVVGWLFRDAKVIPIAPAHEDQGLLDEAFDRIAAELEAGELVCIFPEGKITRDGRLNTFRTGIERIVARTPVPVVPMALVGLWGSIFSRKDGPALQKLPRRLWSRVTLRIAAPVSAAEVSAADLRQRVAALGALPLAPDEAR
jgi:1-acyl-sn-glycerol-3-phosphate acyltransferase